MDGSSIRAGNGMTATVVRQFTPSRIERQLLAQAFELVCGQRSDVEESRSTGQSATHTQRVDAGEQAIDAHVAGRRVA